MLLPSVVRSTSSRRSTCFAQYAGASAVVLDERKCCGIALAQAGAILGRRQPGMPLEAAGEVTLIAEPGRARDVAQAGRTAEKTSREIDAQLPDVGGGGGLMDAPERAREMHWMDAGRFRHGGERQRFAETLFDERHRDEQPQRHRGTRRRLAARRLGEHAEREAFDGEARHFVALPELAIEPLREVQQQTAAERHRSREQRRLLAR